MIGKNSRLLHKYISILSEGKKEIILIIIYRCLNSLRPYHGLLLLIEPSDLLDSLPIDSSPALRRLIQMYNPLKSLQTLAADSDLTLTQVFQLTGHLVYWAKARIIYPLCESNVYVVSPDAILSNQLLEAFSEQFSGLCLLQVCIESYLLVYKIPQIIIYDAYFLGN